MIKAIKDYFCKLEEYLECDEDDQPINGFFKGFIIGWTITASILYIPVCIARWYWKSKCENR